MLKSRKIVFTLLADLRLAKKNVNGAGATEGNPGEALRLLAFERQKHVILSGVLMVETARGRLCGSEPIGFTWQNTHESKIEGEEISRV